MGLTEAIDYLLQDLAPHVTDRIANIYRFHDTAIEIRELDAAIQVNLPGHSLKEDVAVSQHFDNTMHPCETSVLLHPFGKSAMNSAANGYARTPSRSLNTQFASLLRAKTETRQQQQLEHTMRDEHAANISASIRWRLVALLSTPLMVTLF